MIAKGDLEMTLEKYFGYAVGVETIRQASEEIAGLEKEWEPLDIPVEEMGFTKAVNCPDICFLADRVFKGETIRLFRKRGSKSPHEN